MASLYVRDNEANALATRLAQRHGISKTAAVKLALQHELDRQEAAVPLRERMAMWRQTHLPGRPTGFKADKAFYDSLNDEDGD
ncbi:type II toxin-antitoxin system VapB family antitoxin [Sphingomonas sp. A2-49]|uniref:type II toxin-antitoxin system VapB family antitoxin n=1 Tax=Sphingomonas sp. A2-49 TaxID=1391375 RepID=UPI0021D0BCC1|nr:type II toxin-antitoxin system VapB family antitoxin [Sphingomonas sp. A2-49]MCU6455573.1 type II toxin-antitoxin system VapB family antitoxin [Sphingomonas sp. A2-49]